MKFTEVLPTLKAGKKIKRKGWEKEEYIKTHNFFGMEEIVTKYNIVYALTIMDLEADDWEIVKETKKVKLRDLTKKQYQKRYEKNCQKFGKSCDGCPFQKVQCYNDDRLNNIWYLNKDLYSDEFLDQEIEIEED